MKRKLLLLITPPIDVNIESREFNLEQAGAGDIPALGILTLASALKKIDGLIPIYLDGMACPFFTILDFISDHKDEIFCICISVLSATYGAGLKIFKHSRQLNPKIIHIVGNDHFTALSSLCLQNQKDLIDFGFAGNEIIESFSKVISSIIASGDKQPILVPGLVFRGNGSVIQIPQKQEKIFTAVDYKLMDMVFNHSEQYSIAYEKTFPKLIEKWFGRTVHKSMSIELARGCVKFRDDDQCSFCSIQYGGMWKNSLASGAEAWESIRLAYQAGYDHLFITADELPLTFHRLLTEMESNIPEWIYDLPESKRPILSGYARADGLSTEKSARQLYNLGFRFLYIGVDAGPVISLKAFNKQLSGKSQISLEKLYDANQLAFKQASKVGLKLDVGFVLGHMGMTKELLQTNVAMLSELIENYYDSIGFVDVNIIIPEPGSNEYQYLLQPQFAEIRAKDLGLQISPRRKRERIANKWKEKDIVHFDDQVSDYITAFMPELSIDDLFDAKRKIRSVCLENNVQYGYTGE